jgi:hypothetical protein
MGVPRASVLVWAADVFDEGFTLRDAHTIAKVTKTILKTRM